MALEVKKPEEKPRRLFLGIDESNHGLKREYHVGCVTEDPNYTRYHKKGEHIQKYRGEESSRLRHIFPAWYIEFGEDIRKQVNPENYKIMAVGEFMKFFVPNHQIEKVFVDGEIGEYRLENMLEMISTISPETRLAYGKDLDRKVMIVNQADNLANLLFRHYIVRKERNPFPYAIPLPAPNIKDYEKYFI